LSYCLCFLFVWIWISNKDWNMDSGLVIAVSKSFDCLCSRNALCSIQLVATFFWVSPILMCRLLRTRLEKISMHLNSTLRICYVQPLHFSSTPFMILIEKVLISSVDTLSVFVRVLPLLFLTVSGSTYLIMMLQHSLSNPERGTPGTYYTMSFYTSVLIHRTIFNHRTMFKIHVVQVHIQICSWPS